MNAEHITREIKMSDAKAIMYESQVVQAVAEHLQNDGWEIVQALGPYEQGDDIIAKRRGMHLHIECKGEGSEKPNTHRFGKTFTGNQVRNHVANALYRSLITSGDGRLVGMAFPATDQHRRRVAALPEDLGVLVFWVSQELDVTVE